MKAAAVPWYFLMMSDTAEGGGGFAAVPGAGAGAGGIACRAWICWGVGTKDCRTPDEGRKEPAKEPGPGGGMAAAAATATAKHRNTAAFILASVGLDGRRFRGGADAPLLLHQSREKRD